MNRAIYFFIAIASLTAVCAGTAMAQCTATVTASASCALPVTLKAAPAFAPWRIAWSRDGSPVQTYTATWQTNGITVAGNGTNGSGPGQLGNTNDVFVDAAGNIYVADFGYLRIQKWAPGSVSGVTVAGGNGAGANNNQFSSPRSIAVDAAGYIYVLDQGNSRVMRFPPNSTKDTNGVIMAGGNGQGAGVRQMNNPRGLSLDAAGNIYVADQNNHRILKFPSNSTKDTDGVIVAGGNSAGSAANQLSTPTGVFVDRNGYIYVADQNNARIQRFPPNSTKDSAGFTVAGNGQISSPVEAWVDGSGNIYVIDGQQRARRFPPGSTKDSAGINIAGGSSGSGPVNFNTPAGLCVDDSGNLYVADFYNFRVQKFRVSVTDTLAAAIAGNYTAAVLGFNGCTATASSDALAAKPVITPSGSTTICEGDSLVLRVPAGATAYQWYEFSDIFGTSVPVGGADKDSLVVKTAGVYQVEVTGGVCPGISANVAVTVNPHPSAVITGSSLTHVSCNGGSDGAAEVTAGGGSSPYTYVWSPTGGSNAVAANLKAGNYTVTVRDSKGCTATATAGITEPPALTAAISSSVNINCNGGNNGSATVTAGGGTSPYTYSWSPSGGSGATASGLSAGNYTVTVTDNKGCTKTATATITAPAVLTATISSSTNINCNGGNNGSATVTAGGGTSPYTYSWSPSGGSGATASGLSAGNYTVTVTDNKGCTKTATINITAPAALTATISSAANVSCNGGNNGSATVTAGGGTSPYTYSWSPSGGNGATASNLAAGSYMVTVTDNKGCTKAATANVTEPAVLTATISSNTNVTCNGGSNGSATVTAGGGTSPYAYSWSPSGGTGATASNLVAGNYAVTVTDNKGCTKTASTGITEPAPINIQITAGGPLEFCEGDSVTLTATVPFWPRDYQWKNGNAVIPGATTFIYVAKASGNYSVVATDNTVCKDSTGVTAVTMYPHPAGTIVPGDTAFCAGGSAVLQLTTTDTGLSYRWKKDGVDIPAASSDFYTAATGGSYRVVLTRTNIAGCSDSVTPVLITVHPLPSPGINWNEPVFTTEPFYTAYRWYRSGTLIPAASGNTCTAADTGFYYVEVTDSNGCENRSPVFNLDRLDISDLPVPEVRIYPNPVSNMVYIEAAVPVSVIISSMDGKQLIRQSGQHTVGLGHLADGVYLIRLYNESGGLLKQERLLKRE